MLNVNEARNLAKTGKVRLNFFDKIQIIYVNRKIRRYAKQTLTEVPVNFIRWKVAYILEKRGYKLYGPIPEFLNPKLLPDVTTFICWEK